MHEEAVALSLSTREDAQNLQTIHSEIETTVAKSQPITNIPTRTGLTFNDIRNYFKAKQISNPSSFNISTFEGEYGANPGTGTLNKILEIINCKHDANIIPCLKDSSNLIKKLREANEKITGNPGTLFAKIKLILKILDSYPNILPDFDLFKQREEIKKEFDRLKLMTDVKILTAQQLAQVSPFSEIKSKLVKAYPDQYSMERLLLLTYESMPCRDNFGNLFVTDDPDDVLKDETQYTVDGVLDQNFIVVNENIVQIYLAVYKTSKKYGVLKSAPFPKKAADIIRKSLKDKARDYFFLQKSHFDAIKETDSAGDNTYDKLYASESLSSFLSAMLKKAKVKQEFDDTNLNSGAFNLLRHSLISQKFKDDPKMSSEAREKLSRDFQHSPVMSTKYVNELRISEKSDKELENIEKKSTSNQQKDKSKAQIGTTKSKPKAKAKTKAKNRSKAKTKKKK